MGSGADLERSDDRGVQPFRTDVVVAEIIDDMPPRKELIKIGKAALADTGVDPDSWVDAETEAQLRRATPDNTLDALYWGWGRWISWTGRTCRKHLPAHPNSVRQYIKDHWEMRRKTGEKCGRYGQPYAPQTVELAVYTISMVHNRLGFHSPLQDPKVAEQLAGYANDFEAAGFRTDESAPVTHVMSCILGRSQDLATVNGLRNAALFRGQFDMGCRVSEWCHVQGQDLEWVSEEKVVVTFTRTKTKKKRSVRMQAVRDVFDEDGTLVGQHPDWDVDPVRLLLAYYRARRSAGWDGTGPLWVDVSPGQRRLDYDTSGILAGRFRDGAEMTREAYEDAFNRAVRKTGIDLNPVTGERTLHITTQSNRAGMITASVDAGIPLEKVAKRTGHSPASPVIHRYYRTDQHWDDDNAGVTIRRAARPAGGSGTGEA